MKMAKCLGGIGFKDLEIFNKDLLGKQVWKMFKEPSSLLVKVLKGVYFHDKSMLEVRKGVKAFWT